MTSERPLTPEFVLCTNGKLWLVNELIRSTDHLILKIKFVIHYEYGLVFFCLFFKRNRNCFVVFIQPDINTRRGWENPRSPNLLLVFATGYINTAKQFLEWMIDERSSSSYLIKTTSEHKTGIEPATFWWPLRRCNHWATETQMVS